MALMVKRDTKWAAKSEVTEGLYVAPAAAGDFIKVTEKSEISGKKENIESGSIVASLFPEKIRNGIKKGEGSIEFEAKAGSTEGDEPESGIFFESLLGAKTQLTAQKTTKSSGNTGSILQIEDADIGSFTVGMIVCVLESGAYHVSPITTVTTTEGSASITLLVAKSAGSFSNSVKIAEVTTYKFSNTTHPSLSVTKFLEDAVREYINGAKVSGFELSNFKTGSVPTFNFKLAGMGFNSAVSANSYAGTESYDTSLPTVALSACVYKDGVAYGVDELGFSMENTLSEQSTTCASNGIVSQKVTGAKASGTLMPYKQTDSVAEFTLWDNATEFSLFLSASNPTATAGQFNQTWAMYLPKCQIVELSEKDKDGLLQNSISYRVNVDTVSPITVAFI
jgi:hypothetical protein